MSVIRVGVVEDDPDMLAFLTSLVDDNDGMELAYACATYASAVEALDRNADLALVDIDLPDGNGIDFIKRLQGNTQTKSLILTILGDRASVLLAFEVGANGYLLKDTPAEQIMRDIRAVIDGGNPISPQAATHVLSMMSTEAQPVAENDQESPDAILTSRERDVLQMFSRGLSYKEAAGALGMSVNTLNGHVKSIYSKMSVHSRNEAIFEAVQKGWIEL